MSPPLSFPVVVDGVLQAADTLVLPAQERGFLHGLGVFETLRVEQGHALFLSSHLARLERGAHALGIPWPPPADPARSVQTLVRAVPAPTFALRLTLGAGTHRPVLVATAREIGALPEAGLRVRLSPYRVAADELSNVKSTSRLRYALAREEARSQGAQEALLLNAHGDLAEGAVSNVFVVTGAALATPGLDQGCLGGLLRGRLLGELARDPLSSSQGGPLAVEVRPVTLAELEQAQEILLTSSIVRVAGVSALELPGRPPRALPGARGSVARALRARALALEERERAGSSA